MPSADWLKWLGERRDGFLVGAAVLYGLGYSVWSYNAWRNHLGQLPAVEFQYLMAGLIPAFIIAMAWTATIYLSDIQDKVIVLLEKHRFLRWTSAAVFPVVQLTIALGGLATERGWINLGLTTKQLYKYTGPLVLLLLYLSLLTSYTSRERKSSRFMDLVTRGYQYATPVVFCLYSLFIYLDLYPHLPQELGGPKPRCAYVDLVRGEIAPSSLSVLVPTRSMEAATSSEPKVVRSTKLHV